MWYIVQMLIGCTLNKKKIKSNIYNRISKNEPLMTYEIEFWLFIILILESEVYLDYYALLPHIDIKIMKVSTNI